MLFVVCVYRPFLPSSYAFNFTTPRTNLEIDKDIKAD